VGWSEWIRTVEIEPSLYAADFGRLADQVDVLLRTGARVFHWDVGDGHFVEPITMGPVVLRPIVAAIHEVGGAVDVHLMTERPQRQIPAFAEAGADSVTFHYEAVDDVDAAVSVAREHGLEAGLAIKPGTPVEEPAAAAIAAGVDVVLCMSVEPGYSGQAFMPEAIERVAQLRELLPPAVRIQVDGGIDNDNVRSVYDAGATLFVAATAIFGREDLPRAYRRLLQALA
jgi:ribulose-phosphate 3-epimerase